MLANAALRRTSVVLHQTELVTFGIGHDDYRTVAVVMAFAGGPSSQGGYELDGLIDVGDGDVEMDADFAHLRLRQIEEYLEREAWKQGQR
jgi:hypothetical protein